MKYLSVCSGIEAATVAWHPLGWTPLAFSEIEPFPRKVLEHHYPDVRLEGDFTLLREQQWIKDADILVGGTPCQAFSVAGLRNSLDDDRGNLTLEFVRLADAIDALRSVPSTIVWENVPGVLSVKDNAFGCFLGALAGEDAPLVAPGGRWSNAGFVDGPKRAIAWRILDAQYFGVAQRRRRLFVVASARTDFDPAQVLFEFEGVRRDIAPSREKGKEPSATIAARFGISRNNHEEVVTQFVGEVAPTLTKEGTGVVRPGFQEDGWYVAAAMAQPVTYSIMPMNSGKDYKAREVEVSQPIMAGGPVGGNQGGDYIMQSTAYASYGGVVRKLEDVMSTLDAARESRGTNQQRFIHQHMAQTIAPTLTATNDPSRSPQSTEVTNQVAAVHAASMAVRRLTPRECERLQGFPDDYTAIPKAADGPRYKALGNSMAVPVMAWIGKRIANALA
jgi:DNA (cytosine-5)-methyltransferase 1